MLLERLAVDASIEPEPNGDAPKTDSRIRGPRGARVGDIAIAEGTRWLVIARDIDRHEAICKLVHGSGAIRRFRARRIVLIERARDIGKAEQL